MNEELQKRKEELFDLKIIGMYFCLVIVITVTLAIGFCKYGKLDFFGYILNIIVLPICFSIFFIWILFKLYTNFKDKFKEINKEV